MSKLNANSLKRFDAITMIRHYGTVAFGVVMFIVNLCDLVCNKADDKTDHKLRDKGSRCGCRITADDISDR